MTTQNKKWTFINDEAIPVYQRGPLSLWCGKHTIFEDKKEDDVSESDSNSQHDSESESDSDSEHDSDSDSD